MTREYERHLIGCIIDKNHLLALIDKLEEFYNDNDIKIEFNDSTAFKDLTAEEIRKIDFSNKVIKSIHVSLYKSWKGEDKDKYEKSSFYLDSSSWDGIYRVSFSASDIDFFAKFKVFLDDWINSIQNKGRKTLLSFTDHNFLVSFILSLVLTGVTLIGVLLGTKEKFDAEVYVTAVVVFLMIYYFVSSGIIAAFKKCFPGTEIDIGINRPKKYRKFVWILLTVFILPFVYMFIELGIKR